MRFLFMQKSGLPWHGVMSLSAWLKCHGHDVDLLLTDEHRRSTLRLIKIFGPDMVGFPVITGEHEWVWNLSREIKEAVKTEIVVGGPHPTFYPGLVPLHVDFKIPGEAEHSLLRLLDGLVDNKPYPLEQDLDQFPEPDRSIYYKYGHLREASTKQFLTGRGCPYQCSFCSNHVEQKMYQGQRFVRRRSPESVILEILSVKRRYGFKSVSFTDDVFTLNREWLERFLWIYKNEVRVPFMCNTRCELVSGDLLDLLVGAGCDGLEMGIESGVEYLREEVLNKGGTTNSQIVNAGRAIKARGLKLKTYNMIGIPGETIQDAIETMRVNAAIKPDFTACSFLLPYPRYDIAKHFETTGRRIEIPDSIYKPLPGTQKEFVNLQTFFFLGVKFPWLIPVIKLLIKLPVNPIYRIASSVVYGWFMSKVHHMSIRDALRWRKHIKPERI